MVDLKTLRKIAESHGYSVTKSRRGSHYIFRNPEGRKVATASSSPSDYRSRKNTIAHLRAAGLPIPHKGGRKPKRGNHQR